MPRTTFWSSFTSSGTLRQRRNEIHSVPLHTNLHFATSILSSCCKVLSRPAVAIRSRGALLPRSHSPSRFDSLLTDVTMPSPEDQIRRLQEKLNKRDQECADLQVENQALRAEIEKCKRQWKADRHQGELGTYGPTAEKEQEGVSPAVCIGRLVLNLGSSRSSRRKSNPKRIGRELLEQLSRPTIPLTMN